MGRMVDETGALVDDYDECQEISAAAERLRKIIRTSQAKREAEQACFAALMELDDFGLADEVVTYLYELFDNAKREHRLFR